MLKKLFLLLGAVVAILLVVAATRPDSFRVERSATINAPAEKIFPLINDFRSWAGWSPWDKMDPQLKREFSGAPLGKGTVYAWSGNKDVGKGRMEIVESTPSSKIVVKLDFEVPFEAHNMVDFTLVPEAGGTRVTHAMYGPSPFIAKVMGLFFSMDSMVGGKFEEGLAALKVLAEK